ncbi:MAG: NADH-quinone oxidoreductase subunit C [Phycisphaerae bacterium]|nr:NADH-quinone oxidoreductase subunit C [Phycisphaerae bacterium]
MQETQAVQAELMKTFPGLGEVRVPRARRIFWNVPYAEFARVFEAVTGPMKFTILCTMTGLDLGDNLGVIYHLARTSGVTLSLGTQVPKDAPVLQTISHVFPAADLYERELIDLLGIQVQGLGEGPRYPLPDGWPAGQYPLRKDWKVESLEGCKLGQMGVADGK